MLAMEGHMPDGDRNRARIAVASIRVLLAMKGYAIANRQKRKDACDIHYSLRQFPDGLDALVEANRPLLDIETVLRGCRSISDRFRNIEVFGSASVRRFLRTTHTGSAIARQTSGSKIRLVRSTSGSEVLA